MIQSTAATLRLAAPSGAAAPGVPVTVGGGGIFTLPGAGTGGEVAPGATMPDLASMMVALPAEDRQPDAATGKGLPMAVISPLPIDASLLASLPAALVSPMPQVASVATKDGLVTCGLMIGKPLGLKPAVPGGAQPVPLPTPKVPLPVKAPPSGASPVSMPVHLASPPTAASPVVAPAALTPPTAPTSPPRTTPMPTEPLAANPIVSSPPVDEPQVRPVVQQGTAAPAPLLAGDQPTVSPIILTAPETSPPNATAAATAAPLAEGEAAVPPIVLTPPVSSAQQAVAAEFPQPVDIIYVDADSPAAMAMSSAPVVTTAVVSPYKLPRVKSDIAPITADAGGPVPGDPAADPADTALPTAPPAVMPTDVQAPATPPAVTVPLVTPPSKQAAVATQPAAGKPFAAAASPRPTAMSPRSAKLVAEPVSPMPVAAGPTAAKPIAPEQIFVAADTPAAQPAGTGGTLPRSIPIVEYAPIEAADTPPVPPAAAVTDSRPVMPDDIVTPAVPPTAALAAAVPIAGAVAQPTAPTATASPVATPPREEFAAMAASLNATIATSTPFAAADPATHLTRPFATLPTPAAVPPAATTQPATSNLPPAMPAAIATTIAAAAPTTTGVAPTITAMQTRPASAPTSVVEGPVIVRGTGKPAVEARIDTPQAAPLPYLSPAPVGTTASAGIVFGAAKLAAQRSEREDRMLTLGSEALAAATAPAERLAVAATQGGNQPSLDMTDQRWPHAMVAHIEALRDAVADAANAADTRIRLVPDALGGIDIGVRQEGDTLHVHFAADQPQTRALLQEAQPRLAEAAEARGLKLGHTSVGTDAGQSQQRQQQQPHQSAAQPVRRNSFTATTSADEAGDGRIA